MIEAIAQKDNLINMTINALMNDIKDITNNEFKNSSDGLSYDALLFEIIDKRMEKRANDGCLNYVFDLYEIVRRSELDATDLYKLEKLAYCIKEHYESLGFYAYSDGDTCPISIYWCEPVTEDLD